MIAMQYRFRLPADYNMAIISTRVQENGHRLDGYPGLLLKAYCYSEKESANENTEPLYAPFYLWQDSASMARFLSSDGFKRLTRDFGWPQIDTWLVLHFQPASDLAESRFATRRITPIAAYHDLAELSGTTPLAREYSHILAWDVQRWQHLHFRLAATPPDGNRQSEHYRIGHLSLPDSIRG